MSIKTLVGQLYQTQIRVVRRVGLATDVATQPTTTNLFTVSGGDVLVLAMYGKVMATKQVAAQTIAVQHTPTAGVAAAIAAASATTSGDAINSIYSITGVPGDALIVAQVATALGVGQNGNALGTIRSDLVLVAGIISMLTGGATDNSGLVDWVISYVPLAPASLITVL